MRTELGKRSPLYRGFKIWNGLSKTIQDAPSKLALKSYYPICFETGRPKMFNVKDTEGRAQLLYAPVVVRGIGMCV